MGNDCCGDNRFELIKKYKDRLIESTNIETSPEEVAALDNILFRMWQMGWLDSLEALENYKKIKTLMDKYNIKNVDELEHIILNDATGEQAFREYFETNVMPYRNIEKELGISLVTLIKALKDGIYCKGVNVYGDYDKNFVKINHKQCEFDIKNKVLYEISDINFQPIFPVKLADYGKTWALTKEELL